MLPAFSTSYGHPIADLPQRFNCQPNLLFGIGRGDREAQRTAIDGHRRKQGGRDQDAVLPKDVAGLNDVIYGADPHANERKQLVVINGETRRASSRDQLPGQAQQALANG